MITWQIGVRRTNHDREFFSLWIGRLRSMIIDWIVRHDVRQGPKLTFLGRRQLATDFFFQSPNGKMWSPKSVNKFFPSQQNTNQKFWSPDEKFGHNLSFKNQNKENAFGAATAIFFPPNNKIKYKHADYSYTYLHWKSTTKESNADHNDTPCFVRLSNLSQLCTLSYLYLLEKKCTRRKNCCLVLCSTSKTIFLLRSVKTIEGSPCFSHQATTVQHLSFQCQNLCQMQRWVLHSRLMTHIT